tara:strand:+ start:71 stop:454 length:384 start_codon:yes stop_codon:yes gene_type:complete
MKKLLYTFLAVSIIFSACEDDNASPINAGNSSGLVDYDIDCTTNGICSLTYTNSNGYQIDTLINSDWNLSFYGNIGDTVSLTVNTQNSTIGVIDVKIYYEGILRANSSTSFNVSSINSTTQTTVILD